MRFNELCDFVNDQCDPAQSGTNVYLGLEHIDSGAFQVLRHGDPKDVRSLKSRFQKGDILYGKLRPYLDKGILADSNGICSTDLLVLRPKPGVCGAYVLGLIHSPEFLKYAISTTHGVNHPRTSWAAISGFNWNVPGKREQEKIAAVLWKVWRSLDAEEKLISSARELKQAAMHQLFTRGLRGEAQKETEIGLLPNSWNAVPLEDCCDVVNSSLSYTDFERLSELSEENAVLAFGIKVSDMNLPGNESQILSANLKKRISLNLARRKLVPGGVVVFPKRGAAIATNKKRMTTTWTVLDPNLIGVLAGEGVNPRFLFYWFQNFDLRTITEPGPTPQLNKKNLTPLSLPIPSDSKEQEEITGILEIIDRKISTHQQKHTTLQDLFKTLLHELMTGQIRVERLEIDTSEVQATGEAHLQEDRAETIML